VCTDCVVSKHNKHNFEPVEQILSEKLDDLKGAEARYSGLFMSQNVFLTVFLSISISFCSFRECLVIPSINCFSLFLIVVIDSSHKDSHLVSLLSKHKKHNFEPVEQILSEKLDDLKGAEARYSEDLTLCRAKVEEFQISETSTS
jgi:transcriptional regulator of heat shock response